MHAWLCNYFIIIIFQLQVRYVISFVINICLNMQFYSEQSMVFYSCSQIIFSVSVGFMISFVLIPLDVRMSVIYLDGFLQMTFMQIIGFIVHVRQHITLWKIVFCSRENAHPTHIYSVSLVGPWPTVYHWLSKLSANERRCYKCNVFSNWLTTCSAIDRDPG